MLTEERYNEERMKQGRMRHLYTVEIPDDTGENYLSWNEPLSKELVDKVAKALPSLNEFDIRRLKKNGTGEDLYRTVSMRLAEEEFNDDEKASKFLSSLGIVGIKYPADFMRGGREDGKKNYVIFDEKDAKITDRVRFFRTAKGEAYGFTVGGKIYIDPKIANAETPIHEYAHLWAAALRGQNPKEWQNIVELMKGTSVWDEVKKRYPELNADDDIADEVLATYSGRRGAERLREEQRKIAGGKGGVLEKTEAISALERVKQALRKFWKSVADFLHIHYKSAEEVNERFNEQLGSLTADNADNVVLSLGRPSKVLLSAGVENKPMKLYGNKVFKKMRKHGFALEELRNLPSAVADPIAVFNNYGANGNRSILTELKTRRGNFLVSVNIGKDADVDFNIVTSVFGKGKDNIADWLTRGLATYINKEKVLNYLHHSALHAVTSSSSRLSSEESAVLSHHSAPIAATAANAELSSAAKVVENFEKSQIRK